MSSSGIGRAALIRLLLKLVRFPLPTICRHAAAADILNEMGEAGIPLDKDLVQAIVGDNSAGDAEAERILLACVVPDPQSVRRVVCAAIRLPGTSRVVCGARHYDTVMREQIRSLIDAGDAAGQAWYACEQGFIDQAGRWMERGEAMQIARVAGQIVGSPTSDELHSEDIY